LIQVDGKLPNIALMKLSKYHKEKGDKVTLIDLSTLDIDRWYGSKIFMGGSGYDLKEKLPKEIEELSPDYDLYKTDYSIGFTSRGCIRNCGFCIVREKEGNFTEEDMNFIKHTKVILFDNNFLASGKCIEKLNYFIENKIKVCFNQGLDIRLVTKEIADVLKNVKYYDLKFNRRRLYFAWDDLSYEKYVVDGINTLVKSGIRSEHLMFYVLCGFNTTFEQDFYRFKVLNDLGCLPFVMLYNNTRDVKLRYFSRWVNKRYYKVCTFEEYLKQKTKKELM
jgi:hypothetical protein